MRLQLPPNFDDNINQFNEIGDLCDHYEAADLDEKSHFLRLALVKGCNLLGDINQESLSRQAISLHHTSLSGLNREIQVRSSQMDDAAWSVINDLEESIKFLVTEAQMLENAGLNESTRQRIISLLRDNRLKALQKIRQRNFLPSRELQKSIDTLTAIICERSRVENELAENRVIRSKQFKQVNGLLTIASFMVNAYGMHVFKGATPIICYASTMWSAAVLPLFVKK